jgi:hypothetical protein
MASALEQQVQSVLSDSRSARYNVPASDRTYLEILSDPAAGDLIRRDVVEAFREQFISSPPVRQQEMRGIETDDPSYVPMEAPAGGLQTGEYIDEEGSISYDSELEATQKPSLRHKHRIPDGWEDDTGGPVLARSRATGSSRSEIFTA